MLLLRMYSSYAKRQKNKGEIKVMPLIATEHSGFLSPSQHWCT